MERSDASILREVRRELARTPVRLEQIQFGVTRGVIFLGGQFQVQARVRTTNKRKYFEILVSTLVALEKRLRQIKGAKDISFRFNNVHKSGRFWRQAY
jgi:hypothetical protein